MELLRHELFKIFSRRIVWVAAAFFLAITLFFVYNQSRLYLEQYGDMTAFYQSVYQGHEGTITAQTAAAAEKENETLSSQLDTLFVNSPKSILIQRRMTYDNAVSNAKVNQGTRLSRVGEYRQAMNKTLGQYGENSFAYRNAALHYDMVKRLIPPGVYFSFPWGNALDFPVVIGFLILTAMILVGVSPIFSDEYATGVDALILSSRWGKRKITGVKVLSGAIYCVAVALLFLLVNTAGYFITLGTAGAGAPLQSVFRYLASPYSFTVGQFFFVETLIYIAAGVCFGLLVMFVSALSKNVLIPFFSCGCLIGLTAGLKVLDVVLPGPLTWIEDFSYSELMRVSGLFDGYKTYSIFGHPVLYLPLALIVFSIVSTIALWLTIRIFRLHQIENA